MTFLLIMQISSSTHSSLLPSRHTLCSTALTARLVQSPHGLKQLEITAVYIYLQIDIILQDEEAFTIYERNRNDTRAPLLVWCYGQMGLWNVLERVRKREGL